MRLSLHTHTHTRTDAHRHIHKHTCIHTCIHSYTKILSKAHWPWPITELFINQYYSKTSSYPSQKHIRLKNGYNKKLTFQERIFTSPDCLPWAPIFLAFQLDIKYQLFLASKIVHLEHCQPHNHIANFLYFFSCTYVCIHIHICVVECISLENSDTSTYCVLEIIIHFTIKQ